MESVRIFVYRVIFILLTNEANCVVEIWKHEITASEHHIEMITVPQVYDNSQLDSSVFVLEVRDLKKNYISIHYFVGIHTDLFQRLPVLKLTANIRENALNNPVTMRCIRIIREVRGHESKIFKSIFKVNYFESISKMYRVKGNQTIVIKQVPAQFNQLTHQDAFVLYCNNGIFVFMGLYANEKEKKLAFRLGKHILYVDSRGYDDSTVYVIDKFNTNEKEMQYFLSQFPQSVPYISQYEDVSDDEFAAKRYFNYILTDESSEVTSTFVYIGKSTSTVNTKLILQLAESYSLTRDTRKLLVVQENYFPAEFLINFVDYEQYLLT